MTGGRIKSLLILLVVLAGGGALIAATQTWFTLSVEGATGAASFAVDGSTAAPALTALGFAGLALAAALAIAGPVIRIVLGILGVAVGGSIVLGAALALADPVAAGAPVVSAATGVSGSDSVHDLVTAVASTAWPVIAIISGILLAIAGIAVIVTVRAWPASSRRYQAARFADAEPGAAPEAKAAREPDAVDDWDELSRGDDPTA